MSARTGVIGLRVVFGAATLRAFWRRSAGPGCTPLQHAQHRLGAHASRCRAPPVRSRTRRRALEHPVVADLMAEGVAW